MKSTTALSIGLLLAGSLCLLPFLIPHHDFALLPEWLAAVLGIAAVVAALAGRGAAALPVPARWLGVFALFLAARAALGDQAYPQTSLLAALYVLYAVLLIGLGAQLAASLGLERVAVVLAAFLLAGALANSLAGLAQFYGRPALLEDLVADLRGNRAYGNIAQANLYANYLALGEGAVLFLWLRARVRTPYALAALCVLVVASALSESRGAAVYALWYAALGLIAMRLHPGPGTRRLGLAACLVSTLALTAHFAVPQMNEALGLGPPRLGSRLLDASGHYTEPRAQAFLIALRAFGSAPITGIGMGGFAGVAFDSGLDPTLTQSFEVWTSPHNLFLHLLAETGMLGAVLVLGALCVWGWNAARRYRSDAQLALWWILAAAGIELIHSMTEFPLWSAHFLAVTALLMGASTSPESAPAAVSRAASFAAAAVCAVFAVFLGVILRDYVRLDEARITGTTLTLASPARAQRDAATMRELTRGFFAPVAELWIFLGAPLDRTDLGSKLAMSERVASFWPTYAVIARRAAFLALDGKGAEARGLLARALRTFPQRRDGTLLILEMARAADSAAIEPLLAMARAAPSPAVDPRR